MSNDSGLISVTQDPEPGYANWYSAVITPMSLDGNSYCVQRYKIYNTLTDMNIAFFDWDSEKGWINFGL